MKHQWNRNPFSKLTQTRKVELNFSAPMQVSLTNVHGEGIDASTFDKSAGNFGIIKTMLLRGR